VYDAADRGQDGTADLHEFSETQFIAGGLDVTGGAVAVIEALLVLDCSASGQPIAFSGVTNSH
jgi:hypothetical protein